MPARKRKCRTPEKKKYERYGEALWVLRNGKFNGLRRPVAVYRCRGHFHLTSKPRRKGL